MFLALSMIRFSSNVVYGIVEYNTIIANWISTYRVIIKVKY